MIKTCAPPNTVQSIPGDIEIGRHAYVAVDLGGLANDMDDPSGSLPEGSQYSSGIPPIWLMPSPRQYSITTVQNYALASNPPVSRYSGMMKPRVHSKTAESRTTPLRVHK